MSVTDITVSVAEITVSMTNTTVTRQNLPVWGTAKGKKMPDSPLAEPGLTLHIYICRPAITE